jgi:pimeloyl-ACP methyl ester carboxylesterase
MDVRSRGFDIHYKAAGEPGGEALLLVHGILQSAARWIDMGYLDAFSADRRVIAVDLLGHGDSAAPHDPGAYGLSSQVDDLCAVLDAEAVTRFSVWGYSGGAPLALALARRQPERVGAVVVGGIPPDLPADVRSVVSGAWGDALRAGDWDRFWSTFLPVDAATRRILEDNNDPVAVAAWLEGMSEEFTTWDPVPVPTLVYMGTKEMFFDMAADIAAKIGAEFAAIEGRGHAGAFQDLAAVAPLARRLLDRVPAG